jgi:pyruvate formate lyase activating enzyme
LPKDLREADFWEPAGEGRVRCLTCPNECERGEGGVTECRTRINRGGKLYTMTYGKPCVVFQDPLEKNPLYHVAPGSEAIGIGTAGCNLSCLYCQNWEFSQSGPWQTRNMDLSPEEVVQRARERGLRWITFSYTEPVAYFEYALATAREAARAGLKTAVVTAAYINRKPLAKLIGHCDAFSVTLKGYDDRFYRDVIGCPRDDVWGMIVELARSKRWCEVVTLIVPTMNDDEAGLRSIARSLARVGRDIPLHFLRFFPAFKLKNLPPTPLATLERARAIALEEGLRFVYLANLPGHRGGSTYCSSCGELLVERSGFNVVRNALQDGACGRCRQRLPGLDLAALPAEDHY